MGSFERDLDPLGEAYAATRRALTLIDRLDRRVLDGEQKKLLRRVMAAMHEAEDALGVAIARR